MYALIWVSDEHHPGPDDSQAHGLVGKASGMIATGGGCGLVRLLSHKRLEFYKILL